METAEQIEQAAPGSTVSASTRPVASGRPVTGSTGILAHIPEPARVVNRECGICGFPLSHSSWVVLGGLRAHPSCAEYPFPQRENHMCVAIFDGTTKRCGHCGAFPYGWNATGRTA